MCSLLKAFSVLLVSTVQLRLCNQVAPAGVYRFPSFLKYCFGMYFSFREVSHRIENVKNHDSKHRSWFDTYQMLGYTSLMSSEFFLFRIDQSPAHRMLHYICHMIVAEWSYVCLRRSSVWCLQALLSARFNSCRRWVWGKLIVFFNYKTAWHSSVSCCLRGDR